MTEDQKEEFNHIAYSYRSWPGDDQAGVVARYDELVKHVEDLINTEIVAYFVRTQELHRRNGWYLVKPEKTNGPSTEEV